MSRVINTNSPGKRRSAHMRTIAEILRRLSQEREATAETRDMVAMLVFSLRAIDETVEESVRAWEKRGYWKKADDFQQKWWWASLQAGALEKLLREESWHELPDAMIKLLPRVAHIEINRLTRNPSNWAGAHKKLVGM